MSDPVSQAGATGGKTGALGGNFGDRLAEESLLQAAAHLERVISTAPPVDPWYEEVHAAIRCCTLAVEYHLNSIHGPDGTRECIGRTEPRLLPRIESLDTALNLLLLEFWEAKEPAVDPRAVLIESLGALAARLRWAASGEIDIDYEWITAIGGED